MCLRSHRLDSKPRYSGCVLGGGWRKRELVRRLSQMWVRTGVGLDWGGVGVEEWEFGWGGLKVPKLVESLSVQRLCLSLSSCLLSSAYLAVKTLFCSFCSVFLFSHLPLFACSGSTSACQDFVGVSPLFAGSYRNQEALLPLRSVGYSVTVKTVQNLSFQSACEGTTQTSCHLPV